MEYVRKGNVVFSPFARARSRSPPSFNFHHTNTALPRVGVERPNGSYVARTCSVGRAIFPRSQTNVDVSSRLPNINSTDTSDGRRSIAISLPAYLYALAKFPTAPAGRYDRCSSTSQHRIVDLASGLGGYTPLLWENENEKCDLLTYLLREDMYIMCNNKHGECRRPACKAGGSNDTHGCARSLSSLDGARARSPELCSFVRACGLSTRTLGRSGACRARSLGRDRTHEAPWLILPVVICLSQRLSHACLSACRIKVKPRMAH